MVVVADELGKPEQEAVGAAAPSSRKKVLLAHPGAIFGIVIIVVQVLLAVFAPWIAPHDPNHTYPDAVLAAPSARFWFGTDELGRDVLSRVIYGARVSLQISAICVSIAAIVGSLLGLLAAFYRGAIDPIIMRAMDVVLAFPEILLAIAVIAILGPGLNNTMVAIGIALTPVYARTVRAAALQVADSEYVRAATVIGVPRWRILVRHVLRNVWTPIIVISTVNIGTTILIAAGLSYVGIGAQPPIAEWGSMLSTAHAYLPADWWTAVFPGLAITFSILAFNLLGDALRDLLDPRLRRRR
jgi:ABC-type dipeptide/oligopeptide/nickel transport system permease subunit